MAKQGKFLPGVTQHKCGTYRAKAHRDGKSVYIGTYKTEKEAHEAYLEFVETNRPNTARPENSFNPVVRKNEAYDNLRAAWNSIFL
jgi:hypothetical protein